MTWVLAWNGNALAESFRFRYRSSRVDTRGPISESRSLGKFLGDKAQPGLPAISLAA